MICTVSFVKPLVVHLDFERGWRGGERQVLLLAQGLAKQGYSQLIIGRLAQPLLERAQHAQLPTKAVTSRAQALLTCLGLSQTKQPIIFHAHTGNAIPVAVLAAQLRRGAKSLVTRRLDLQPRSFFLRRADHVVAISNAVADVVNKAGVAANKLSLIHSAVEYQPIAKPQQVRTCLRLQLGLSATTPLILAIGAIVDQKDPLCAVRALQYLPSAHLLWLGEGPLLATAQKTAEQLGIQDRLHWQGFDSNPNRWFLAADVFCLPSRYEGLGTSYLDAFFHRLPVVGTDIPGSDDVLIHRQTALRVPVGDSQQLAAAIQTILNDPALRAHLIEQAYLHAQKFKASLLVDKYVLLYESLLAAKSEY